MYRATLWTLALIEVPAGTCVTRSVSVGRMRWRLTAGAVTLWAWMSGVATAPQTWLSGWEACQDNSQAPPALV